MGNRTSERRGLTDRLRRLSLIREDIEDRRGGLCVFLLARQLTSLISHLRNSHEDSSQDRGAVISELRWGLTGRVESWDQQFMDNSVKAERHGSYSGTAPPKRAMAAATLRLLDHRPRDCLRPRNERCIKETHKHGTTHAPSSSLLSLSLSLSLACCSKSEPKFLNGTLKMPCFDISPTKITLNIAHSLPYRDSIGSALFGCDGVLPPSLPFLSPSQSTLLYCSLQPNKTCTLLFF